MCGLLRVPVAVFEMLRYVFSMKIGYCINCDPRDLREAGAKTVYADTKSSDRAERACAIRDLRAGDVLLILARKDLGRGREIPYIEGLVTQAGATIEIVDTPDPPRPPARKPGPAPLFSPDAEQERRLRHYWHGPFKAAEALRQAEAIMGRPINRATLNRHLGARSKPRPWINKEQSDEPQS